MGYEEDEMDTKDLDVATLQDLEAAQICELNEVQLALIGGGIGNVIVG